MAKYKHKGDRKRKKINDRNFRIHIIFGKIPKTEDRKKDDEDRAFK